MTAAEPVTLWTIGHSNVPANRFLELLAAHGINHLHLPRAGRSFLAAGMEPR